LVTLVGAGHPSDFPEVRDLFPDEVGEEADGVHGVLELPEHLFVVVRRAVRDEENGLVAPAAPPLPTRLNTRYMDI